MRIRMRAALLAAVTVAGLSVASQPAHGARFHGVVTQGLLAPDDFALMASGNVGTLRASASWTAIQPSAEAPPGEWNWPALDAIVTEAGANGIRVLLALDAPSPPGIADPPTNRKSRRAFAKFASELAKRYGRGGSLGSAPVVTFQIYNEQNGPAYWRARPNPRAYAKVLRAASGAIRKQDRRAEIVLGGMFGTPSGRGAITSLRYLNRLYDLRGAKRAFDTVAVHPYSEGLRGIENQVERIRDVMRRNHDRGARLRITEFGWGSARHGHLNKGRQGQARMLKRAFKLFERKRRAWKLRGVNWFSFQDNPDGACSFCPTSGLFEVDRTPKPSFEAFKRAARR